jgi:hypothetical protein
MISTEDMVVWLQDWYMNQVNGDWEHAYGVVISTLDNPGWSVKIDLVATEFENASFTELKIDRTEDDWLVCRTCNGVFEGYGGPHNLQTILQRFRDWVESQAATPE